MNTICLCMIVKNEAHVIERCLASVLPFIDAWLVVDTGSSDGTQTVVRNALHGLPGELHERPWVDFGHNRSQALELARDHGDYLFVIDADDVLELSPGFVRPPLTAEAYALRLALGTTRYSRVCLLASRLPWCYVGVLHEYPECGHPVDAPRLEGAEIRCLGGGARSRQDLRQKYAADARVLEKALRDEPDNSRYRFYLAQSYRDCGEREAALQCYDQRAVMGGWDEEVWYALYSAALLAEQLQRSGAEVIDRYLKAFDFRPRRAASLCQLARFCRQQGRFSSARLFAARAVDTPMPSDTLFVDRSFYAWRSLDEFAVASYWTGHHADCLRACETLLSGVALPAVERPRVNTNHALARAALGADASG